MSEEDKTNDPDQWASYSTPTPEEEGPALSEEELKELFETKTRELADMLSGEIAPTVHFALFLSTPTNEGKRMIGFICNTPREEAAYLARQWLDRQEPSAEELPAHKLLREGLAEAQAHLENLRQEHSALKRHTLFEKLETALLVIAENLPGTQPKTEVRYDA